MIQEYFEWEQAGKDLLERWKNPARMPNLSSPVDAEWKSRDGRELHRVLGWSSEHFDPAWCRVIHQFAGEASVEDKETWKRQLPVFAEFYGRFFSRGAETPGLNMVTVTPSRVPSHLWPSKRGTLLEERLRMASSCRAHAEPVDLGLLVSPVTLAVRDLLWAPRPDTESRRLRLGVVRAKRMFKRTPSTYMRLFEIDPAMDAASLASGVVPAMAGTLVGAGDGMRVHAPMLQLWRVYPSGMVDLVNLETSRGSGRVVGIRWTSQRFSDLIGHDPYYAMAFTELARRDRGRERA